MSLAIFLRHEDSARRVSLYWGTMTFVFGRRSFIVSSFVLLACSSSESSGGAAPPPSASDAGGGPAPLADVVISQIDRFGHATGNPTDVVVTKTKWVSAAAIVTVDGATKTLPGTARPDGSIAIAGVPAGPWVLDMRMLPVGSRETDPPLVVRYPIDGARTVRFGSNYWARKDAVALTPATKLALTVNAPAAFVDGDTLSWIGLRSYFFRETAYANPDPVPSEGHANVPEVNAMASSGWTVDASVLDAPYGPEASGLPSAAAGDDLTIVQTRAVKVSRDGEHMIPWTSFDEKSVVGVLDAASASFANGTTNTVTGTLAAPSTEELTIDFRGTTYASMRAAAGYPKDARARATIRMSQEAGPGPELFTSAAPVAWSLGASSLPKVTEPSCFPPPSTRCEPAACEVGCAAASDGFVDPGDFSYTFDAPRVYPTGMRDVYDASYAYSWSWKFPGPGGGAVQLSSAASTTRPKTGTTATFALELGPVRNARIDDAILAWAGESTISASAAATVRFDAPELGTPEYYEVAVTELMPDASAKVDDPRTSRTVARLFTRTTSAAIPAGVLRDGHYYYVRVYAMRDGRDFAEPSITKSNESRWTSIFLPPFVVTP